LNSWYDFSALSLRNVGRFPASSMRKPAGEKTGHFYGPHPIHEKRSRHETLIGLR
jgi:hypothetical protein